MEEAAPVSCPELDHKGWLIGVEYIDLLASSLLLERVLENRRIDRAVTGSCQISSGAGPVNDHVVSLA